MSTGRSTTIAVHPTAYSSESQFDATVAVLDERDRQDHKWGADQDHDPFTYLTVLGEEYGELCREALRSRFDPTVARTTANLRTEAVQVAAVALAIVEMLDRDDWVWPGPPWTPRG